MYENLSNNILCPCFGWFWKTIANKHPHCVFFHQVNFPKKCHMQGRADIDMFVFVRVLASFFTTSGAGTALLTFRCWAAEGGAGMKKPFTILC